MVHRYQKVEVQSTLTKYTPLIDSNDSPNAGTVPKHIIISTPMMSRGFDDLSDSYILKNWGEVCVLDNFVDIDENLFMY